MRLIDGSPAPALPEPLARAVGRGELSRVTVVRAASLDARDRSCLSSFRPEFRLPPGTRVVRRIGTAGASLTFDEGGVLLGCDRTHDLAAGARQWCGHSVGRLFQGRLRDPRIDIGCRAARGNDGLAGFGWIQPAAPTRWVVGHRADRIEVEPVAGGLPVRLMTGDVDTRTSTATFDVTELDATGEEVRRYALRAGVSG